MIKVDKRKDVNFGEPVTLAEFTEWIEEIDNQPPFRARMDKEMDYYDGNQLDSELLQKLNAVGIPPAVDNIIQSAINSLCGLEVKTRKDWRVTPDGDPDGQDVADAINYKLNQAERHSKADQACSNAFLHQACVGLGFVEVSRDSDPFKFPYRCVAVHRNEIRWDMLAKNPDTTDWRYLDRSRWIPTSVAKKMWPQHKELIDRIQGGWGDFYNANLDGGTMTGLMDSWETQRSWSVEEQQWHDSDRKRVMVHELWYRRWVNIPTLRFLKTGRVVEYDKTNAGHVIALAQGMCDVITATVSRVRRAYFLGPHILSDDPSPYTHSYFGYAPFFGAIDDRTGVPYGAIKGMVYPQDSLNSATAKLRWGISAMRVTNTKGALAMPDAVMRQQVARPDAHVVLDANHMAQPGAVFKVERDYTLTDQHYQMMQDARASIERISAISASFVGRQGTATSGLQEQTQVEQSNQALAGLMDRFGRARSMVGEMMMHMIIQDMGKNPQTVIIEGDALRPEKVVRLNLPEVDPQTGIEYLSNDVQRIKLKVSLEEVPSSSSFRSQQLNVLGEAVKSMPANMQAAVMPFVIGLMDLPMKRDVIEAIKAAAQQESPEAIQQRIQQAVQDALAKSGNDLKAREVAIKERKADSEIAKLVSESVESGLRAAFAAMQGAQVVAQMPQVAPVADVLMQNAGWRPPTPAGVDPNIPQPAMQHPEMPGEMETGEAPDGDGMTGMHPGNMAQGDTSPLTPANPVAPASPMVGQNRGIETMRSDSFQ